MVCLKLIQIILFPEESRMKGGCVFLKHPEEVLLSDRDLLISNKKLQHKATPVVVHCFPISGSRQGQARAAWSNVRRFLNSMTSKTLATVIIAQPHEQSNITNNNKDGQSVR